MSSSKTKLLQKAFMFLMTEPCFQKRWVSLSSIASALRLRYTFGDHYNFNKAMLSKSLGKLHYKIDSLQEPNDHGVYRCKMLAGYLFTIQDPMLTPPEMPDTHANDSEWTNLCKLDEKLLASYGGGGGNQVNIEKITMTGMPKRNRRYWTTLTLSFQTKSPHTTQQYV
jgi:hypothetical protein